MNIKLTKIKIESSHNIVKILIPFCGCLRLTVGLSPAEALTFAHDLENIAVTAGVRASRVSSKANEVRVW